MTSKLTRRRLIAALPATLLAGRAFAGPTPAPKDAYLYFIWPGDGQRIKGAFWCRFGLRNMGVAPAGVRAPNAGHHHLFVDVDEPLNPNEPIPQDKKHLHFGAGQTEARLDLPPGPHTLQLVLGDADHIPFDPPVISRKIRIVVT
ncbi:MAG TPA: DUF4399 domain-containing protein [Stellaceae bacterium]|nr:DUF4399 domain-containing protein [Stellaceae bacterium]